MAPVVSNRPAAARTKARRSCQSNSHSIVRVSNRYHAATATGPGPDSARPNARGSDRQVPPCVHRQSQSRVALQRRVVACRVVVMEVAELPFKLTGIPERHMAPKFSPHRPDQAFHDSALIAQVAAACGPVARRRAHGPSGGLQVFGFVFRGTEHGAICALTLICHVSMMRGSRDTDAARKSRRRGSWVWDAPIRQPPSRSRPPRSRARRAQHGDRALEVDPQPASDNRKGDN